MTQSVATRMFEPPPVEVEPLMTNRPVTERDLAYARIIAICVPLAMLALSASIFLFAI